MMNRKVLLFFLCMLLSTGCVFADESLPDDSQPVQINDDSTAPVVVDLTQLVKDLTVQDPDEDVIDEVSDPTIVDVETTMLRVSPSDTSGLKAVMLTILGDYETVITDYTYQTSGSYYSHSVSIERDWAWLCSAGMLALLTYCTFRALGGILARC